RFKIWAGNIAAHRRGRRSLEYRLRDATHLNDEAESLLAALERTLNHAVAIVEGREIPWDALADSDSDSDSDSSDSVTSDTGEDTELEQLVESIKTSVTCLFRLSMAIRDPAPDDRLHGTITVDKSYFEKHDILHTKSKYPSCAEYLAERLGRVISGRRQYLNYREQHHQKLAKNVELVGLEQPRTENTSDSTEVTPMPIARSNSANMAGDDDVLSQTSYATSVNATIRVSPMPKEAHEKQHFECPLCFIIVYVHTTAAWKEHVYRNLHPFYCTFEKCPMADHLYESRHAWSQHELEAHRSSWQCIEGCQGIFTTESDFEAHVCKLHIELASPHILTAKRTARKGANTAGHAKCPFCDTRMAVRALQRHVGRHQEQLALFALPPNLDSTDDSVNEDDNDSTEAAVDV
ncbi:hypothetical protein BU23DRAFT_441216, partial [Bimuria novae-zelandiae CBS 107.79]